MDSNILRNTVLLIDKSIGKTSFDILKEIRRITGIKKLGHSGTLDKFASGLLVVCTERATKLAAYLVNGEKRYHAFVKLGERTETDDSEGAVLETRPLGTISERDIISAAEKFRGEISQAPPRYSALKIKGVRASDLARQGNDVELNERRVLISKLEILAVEQDMSGFTIDVTCSKGTYIRSLARDMGEMLGTGGHLNSLRRIRSGFFTIDDAVTVDELKGILDGAQTGKNFLWKPAEALKSFGRIRVKSSARDKILNGAFFAASEVISTDEGDEKKYIIQDEEKNLIAIADIDIDKWLITYHNVFNPAL